MRNRGHIVLVGPMGSGKSSIGMLLADALRLRFIDLDAAIEADAGMPVAAIFEREGEAGFRARESRALAAALADAPAVVASGGGAVLDPANRGAMRDAALVVYLAVDPATQLARLRDDTSRPLLRVADREARLATLQARREPLYREVADLVFDTTPHSPDAAAAALAALAADRMERCA